MYAKFIIYNKFITFQIVMSKQSNAVVCKLIFNLFEQ